MLVEAMAMERSLVVLDDPWTPEQVRFLNPIESSHTEAHRLLVTTRIRGLVPKATCVELSVMGKDEAVSLLLDLANVQKEAYVTEHPGVAWPPQEAYAIVSECGLLPMTLTIAAQVVRAWGHGWEGAVLPLLKEQQDAGGAVGSSTVTDRIIGAGLKVLGKHEDASAIKGLFEMFAVTQEDFIHSMPVIELLWRSCCGEQYEGKQAGKAMMMRLKIRQWAHVLIDHSLLLGSSTNGIHLHDIVLTHLRSSRSGPEMRALQKQVVEGMVAMSAERMEATGRGLQDTGTSAKAFEGEEVDWVSYDALLSLFLLLITNNMCAALCSVVLLQCRIVPHEARARCVGPVCAERGLEAVAAVGGRCVVSSSDDHHGSGGAEGAGYRVLGEGGRRLRGSENEVCTV